MKTLNTEAVAIDDTLSLEEELALLDQMISILVSAGILTPDQIDASRVLAKSRKQTP